VAELMDTITIDMDIYIDMLEMRKDEVEPLGWTIPDSVWNYAVKLIRDCGISPEYTSPLYIVDNIAVNGDYGERSKYGELEDEEIILEYEDEDGEPCVLLNLGI
jgi:hypothetical protein